MGRMARRTGGPWWLAPLGCCEGTAVDMGLPTSVPSLLPGLSQERPGVELLGPTSPHRHPRWLARLVNYRSLRAGPRGVSRGSGLCCPVTNGVELIMCVSCEQCLLKSFASLFVCFLPVALHWIAELQEFSVYSGPQPLVRYVTCTHSLPPGGDFSPWRQCPLTVVVFHFGEVHPIHLFLLLLPVWLMPHPRSHWRPQGHDDASPGTGPAEPAHFCLPCASSSFPPDFAHSVLEGVQGSWHHRRRSLAFHRRGAVATADLLLFTPLNVSLFFRGSWARRLGCKGHPRCL